MHRARAAGMATKARWLTQPGAAPWARSARDPPNSAARTPKIDLASSNNQILLIALAADAPSPQLITHACKGAVCGKAVCRMLRGQEASMLEATVNAGVASAAEAVGGGWEVVGSHVPPKGSGKGKHSRAPPAAAHSKTTRRITRRITQVYVCFLEHRW